jgi:hypothetical protein
MAFETLAYQVRYSLTFLHFYILLDAFFPLQTPSNLMATEYSNRKSKKICVANINSFFSSSHPGTGNHYVFSTQ